MARRSELYKIGKSFVKPSIFCTRFNSSKSNLQYCIDCVRKSDYEHYLCTIMLPKKEVANVMAIRAFNTDVAQAKDVTTKSQIARMRLQFWREGIDRIYEGNPRATPIAEQLHKAVQSRSLNKKWFLNLIEGREQNLEDQPYLNLEEALDYADKVNSSLNYLILQCLGVQNVDADHAASHLGKCQGLLTLIRSVPHHAQLNRVLLPMDLMSKHSVSQQEVMRGSRETKMKDLIFDIATEAKHQLDIMKGFKDKVPKEALPAFLPVVCCDAYLRAIQFADADIFNSKLQLRNGWLPYLIWRQKLRKSL